MTPRKPAEDQEETSLDLTALKARSKRIASRVWNPDADNVGDELEDHPEREGVKYYPVLDVAQILVGQLFAVDRHVGDHDSTMLRFIDPHGQEVATWQRGTLKTQLNENMLGKYVMLEFTGIIPAKKKGMSDMFLFEVYSLTEKDFTNFGKQNKELTF